MKTKEKKVFDRMIHKDEFKLRLLLTDGCNLNCKFCLNDFQQKPKGAPAFMDTDYAMLVINTYARMGFDRRYPKQVYFSGGEPTQHKDLLKLMALAYSLDCRVTLNTNGTFPEDMLDILDEFTDCMHISAYYKSEELARRLVYTEGTMQCVYSSVDPYVTEEFLLFYMKYKIPIKVFGDLNEPHERYRQFAEYLMDKYPDYPFSFRFTGVQENRGIGCFDCDRYCVTLKGAWVFPDNSMSHCPQKCKGEVYTGKTRDEIKEALTGIELAHRYDRKEEMYAKGTVCP